MQHFGRPSRELPMRVEGEAVGSGEDLETGECWPYLLQGFPFVRVLMIVETEFHSSETVQLWPIIMSQLPKKYNLLPDYGLCKKKKKSHFP